MHFTKKQVTSSMISLTLVLTAFTAQANLSKSSQKLHQDTIKSTEANPINFNTKIICDDPELCSSLMFKVRKYAINGSPKAQLYMAVAYLNGDGVEQSNRKAMKWIKKSARAPYPKAYSIIAGWYRNGWAGVVDIDKADYFLDLAVAAGEKKSIIELGSIRYNQGNLAEAKELFQQAAEMGSNKAKRMLELLIMEEQGITEQIASTESIRTVDPDENLIVITSNYTPVEMLSIFVGYIHPIYKTSVSTGSRLPGVKCGISIATSLCRSFIPDYRKVPN